MAFFIGVGLALAISLMASLVGLDRDRAFYPTVTIVVALYYGLFAVIGGSGEVLAAESAVIVVFLLAAIVGFRRNLWIVVGALAAHGVFDSFHGDVIANAGVPVWWPDFCMAYDVTAAGFLAWLLLRARAGDSRALPGDA